MIFIACAFPQWRLSWSHDLLHDGWSRHPLADYYEKRVYHDGILLQRPELELLQKEYPALAKKAQQIPCGKCIQCRLAYSREWANRCMMEFKSSPNAIFVTLTYSNAHLQFAPFVDVETGQVSSRPCLVPKDLQKFFKRLRQYIREEYGRNGLKFFACGEYGDRSSRPHYHAIIYNIPPDLWKDSHLYTPKGVTPALFTSSVLDKLWPYGAVVFGDVNWNTCAYVARYVVKKRKGKDRKSQRSAQELVTGSPDSWPDEFVRMSRRPGIGREYYEKNVASIYSSDAMYVNINGKVQAVRPAKYYDKLYDIDHHAELQALKVKRRIASELAFSSELSRTDLSEEDYLLLKNESKELQAKALVRPSI